MAVRPVTPTAVQFLPPGHAVEVAGHVLPDGMVWVGPSPEPGSNGEPSTIDESLPVATVVSRRDDESMWPAGGYAEMRSGCRAAYLRWLADGRRNPRIDVAYVLLFLGGLERRLLVDPGDATERERLMSEVRRLTGIYGRNPVIRRHATELARAGPLRFREGRVSDGPPPPVEEGAPLPDDLRIGLAELARDGRPLPADWALNWLRAHPESRLRTPARRAPAEFDELFRRQYTATFGDGMLLSPIKTRLDVDYRPVNASLGPSVSLIDPELSEIAPLLAPVGRLRALADDVARELDPYSRWLGRNPDGAGSPAARALLPAALTAEQPGPRTEDLYRHLDAALDGSEVGSWPTGELVGRWNPAADGRISRDETRLLAETLALGGYGLEPDVRFGGPAPSPEGVVVVFRLRHGAVVDATDRYLAAALTLQLAAAVTGSAGRVTAAEERLLEQHLEDALDLTDAERERLRAHLRWVVDSEPGLGGVRGRIRRMPREDRAAVGRFLVGVAATDGRVEPAEVATLTKIFRLLGLQPETVYRQLHGLITGDPSTASGSSARSARRTPSRPCCRRSSPRRRAPLPGPRVPQRGTAGRRGPWTTARCPRGSTRRTPRCSAPWSVGPSSRGPSSTKPRATSGSCPTARSTA